MPCHAMPLSSRSLSYSTMTITISHPCFSVIRTSCPLSPPLPLSPPSCLFSNVALFFGDTHSSGESSSSPQTPRNGMDNIVNVGIRARIRWPTRGQRQGQRRRPGWKRTCTTGDPSLHSSFVCLGCVQPSSVTSRVSGLAQKYSRGCPLNRCRCFAKKSTLSLCDPS